MLNPYYALFTQVLIRLWDSKLRFKEGGEISGNLAINSRMIFFSLTASSLRGLLEESAVQERKCWCLLYSPFPLIQAFIKRFSGKSARSYGFNYTSSIPAQRKLHFLLLVLSSVQRSTHSFSTENVEQPLIIFSPGSTVSLRRFQKSQLYTKCQNFNMHPWLSLDKINNNKRLKELIQRIYVKLLHSHRSLQ